MLKSASTTFLIFILSSSFMMTACGGGGSASRDAQPSTDVDSQWKRPWPTPIPKPTATPAPTPVPTPSPTQGPTAVIYDGPGANQSDVVSIGAILKSHGVSFVTADDSAFNAMSLSALTKFRLMIFPGGDSNYMHAALTDATRLRVKQAIITYGVSYTGFCAGAWMAVGPQQSIAATPYWGFGFVVGDYLELYHPDGQTPMAAMVATKLATGETRELVWWGGPALPEINGGVVGRYKDGVPAIVGTWAGKGYVTITGPHPEAPESWRTGLLNDTDGLDFDLAWKLMDAALEKKALSTF